MRVTNAAQCLHEGGGRSIETALALYRFDDDCSHPGRLDVGLEQALECGQGVRFGDAQIGRGKRGVMDIAGKGTETGLVGHHFSGQGHPHHRATVEASGKRDDTGTACRGARNLDCIFDGLGTGGQEDRLFRRVARRECIELFGQFNIGLIGRHLGTDMGEIVQLCSNGRFHGGVVVPGIGHCNTGGKIEVATALDVPDLGIERLAGEHFVHHAQATRNGGFAAVPDRLIGHVRHAGLGRQPSHQHVFDIQIVFEPVARAFPAKTGLLDPAERCGCR